MYRTALKAGALFGLLAVILGAFGAHGLRPLLDENKMRAYETGVSYQFFHGLALLCVGMLYKSFPNKMMRAATGFFISGMVLFSGSLYLIAFLSIAGTSIGAAGIITPVGGLMLILGWLMMFIGFSAPNKDTK
jgi:uncharacterized membrane protein YgdD (TMEM256/DUF423 family)